MIENSICKKTSPGSFNKKLKTFVPTLDKLLTPPPQEWKLTSSHEVRVALIMKIGEKGTRK